jgi:hypothetical protein
MSPKFKLLMLLLMPFLLRRARNKARARNIEPVGQGSGQQRTIIYMG